MYVYFIIAVDGREWQWRSELDISTGDCKTDASSSKTKVVDVLIFLELFHFVNEIISWNWINTRTLSEWQSLNVQNKFTFTFLLNSGKFRAVSCFFFWCCCCSFSMFIFIYFPKNCLISFDIQRDEQHIFNLFRMTFFEYRRLRRYQLSNRKHKFSNPLKWYYSYWITQRK